jgi:hypothetical protein
MHTDTCTVHQQECAGLYVRLCTKYLYILLGLYIRLYILCNNIET